MFFAIKGGAGHSPNTGYSYRDADRWIKSGHYKNLVNKSNNDIIDIINIISENDPESICILIGDHGPSRLRSIFDDAKTHNRSDLKKYLAEMNLTFKDVADDFLNVFLAVRLPNGISKDISGGYPMSHANLFLHIFAHINDSPEIIDMRTPTFSSLMRVDMVREGKIIQ